MRTRSKTFEDARGRLGEQARVGGVPGFFEAVPGRPGHRPGAANLWRVWIMMNDVGFVGLMMLVGLPLTIVFVFCGGVLHLFLGGLPRWFFPTSLLICVGVLALSRVWARSMVSTDLAEWIPGFVVPANLLIAGPGLIAGWVLWHLRRGGVSRRPTGSAPEAEAAPSHEELVASTPEQV